MYNKILIANRGEIAVRIIRACKEMGIGTVAVHSEADRDAPHVQLADEACCVGPAPDAQSYLNLSAIIEAAVRSHADAIHPGYGFLSENPHFPAVCRTWGIDFIGPEPEAIERMGSKALARQAMIQAGVPVVPGTAGTVENAAEALRTAADLGYPVMVKASYGGGGRGIRIARNERELEEVVEAARREAARYFGNGDIYVEKYLEEPRHIEVQLLADRHGNVVHLFERECSIQRRRQKILEEAPSLALTPELREAICRAAVRAAQAVNYCNAGTVEFLLDKHGNFYFCEMNTRIQVEHPITEMITGIDLIQEQIRVALGERLRRRQEDIQAHGAAIECRIAAEDPDNRLMPCPGTITAYEVPGGPWVRVDGGVTQGTTVTPFYDSLIAKLVVWGEDRTAAIRRAIRALEEYRVEGIKTTIPVHLAVLNHPDFQAGRVHTRFLEENVLTASMVPPLGSLKT